MEKHQEEVIKDKKQDLGGGVRRGFEGGQTPLYRRLPKRGFTNIHAKDYTEVTLTMLNKSNGYRGICRKSISGRIIGKIRGGIVVIATGKLEKKLTVKAKRFTKTAAQRIEELGGKIEVV